MLVIQHIWHRWTKATRGVQGAYKRPLLDAAYPLPDMEAVANPQQEALVHVMAADAWSEHPVAYDYGPLTHEQWSRSDSVLDWRVRGSDIEISLANPSPWRLQTKWPAHLPSPLFRLRPGETARIEWNGRFRKSLFGSNRSSYYEQHIYWLAVTDMPHERLFLDATPRKDIDYTTHIY